MRIICRRLRRCQLLPARQCSILIQRGKRVVFGLVVEQRRVDLIWRVRALPCHRFFHPFIGRHALGVTKFTANLQSNPSWVARYAVPLMFVVLGLQLVFYIE